MSADREYTTLEQATDKHWKRLLGVHAPTAVSSPELPKAASFSIPDLPVVVFTHNETAVCPASPEPVRSQEGPCLPS